MFSDMPCSNCSSIVQTKVTKILKPADWPQRFASSGFSFYFEMSAQEKADAESSIKRNPHPDFGKVEASRPDYEKRDWTFTKTVDPNWTYGSGGNDGGASLEKSHVDIDPYAEGRQAAQNYKLLISGIVPRPIGFLSTRAKDGSSTNLSPFSYTQVVNHDPPIFTVGFAGGMNNAKDSLRNLIDSGSAPSTSSPSTSSKRPTPPPSTHLTACQNGRCRVCILRHARTCSARE